MDASTTGYHGPSNMHPAIKAESKSYVASLRRANLLLYDAMYG